MINWLVLRKKWFRYGYRYGYWGWVTNSPLTAARRQRAGWEIVCKLDAIEALEAALQRL